MALISRTRIGLCRLISTCLDYLNTNSLTLNFSKSKVIVFQHSWKSYSWSFGGKAMQQVREFHYLGITFHFKHNWKSHLLRTVNSSKLTSQAISRFFYAKGNSYVPSALQIFKSKVISQLLYGISVWFPAFNSSVERVQASFLYKILGVPRCVPYAALILETGLQRVEFQLWLRVLRFWIQLCFRAELSPLLKGLLSDSHPNACFRACYKKIQQLGIEADLLGMPSPEAACKLVASRLADVERQEIIAEASKKCSPLFYQLKYSYGCPTNYLSLLTHPQARRAFMLARCNVFPSNDLLGRFHNIPAADRFCNCPLMETETLGHIILRCPKRYKQRQKYLNQLMTQTRDLSDRSALQMLLDGSSSSHVLPVAEFLMACLN